MLHRSVFEGDLNAAFDGDVWSSIDRLVESTEDVVLDLSAVTFIDSQAVGAVVCLIRRLSHNGLQLKVKGLRGQPLRLFLDLHLIPVSGMRQPGDERPWPVRAQNKARGETSVKRRFAASHSFRGLHPH